MNDTITVELSDVCIYATHGLYEEESITGQEFRLDIRLCYHVVSDMVTTIEDTINYEEVFQLVNKEILKDRHLLLEACAMNLARVLKERYPQITQLDIRIEKPNAPIAHFNGKVAIRFTKDYR
jgi:dihydroneopterin aldolase